MLTNFYSILLLLSASVVCLAQERLPSIAILDFSGRNVAAPEAAALTDRFRSELMRTHKFNVMEREEMNVILNEQEFQQKDCVDQSCAVQLGQLIAVSKIVTGTVAKVGGMYTVNIKYMDVATGRIEQNLSEDCDCPIEAVLTQTLSNLAQKLAGLKVEEKQTGISITKGDAGLFVKTNPSEARVYLDGKMQDGVTPLNLENLMAGKHTVEAKKTIDGIIYSGKKDIELLPNAVTRVEVTLEKAKTVLKLLTVPSEAEVYINKQRTLNIFPDYITPAIVYDIRTGRQNIILSKPGYRDTTLSLIVREYEVNDFTVQLSEEKDPGAVVQQQKFIKQRNHRKTGKYTIYASMGLLAAGGLMMYLSQKDYDDAMSAKEKLERASIRVGSEYEKIVKQNQDSNDAYLLKRNIAYGLFGTAGAGGIIGIILYF